MSERPPRPGANRDRSADVGPHGGGGQGNECGQSLVELAVSLTLLLLILFGTIDFGRLFFDYVELRNAAREGAGYGARNPTATAEIRNRALDHGVPDGVVAGDVTVACNPAPTTCVGLAIGTKSTITVTVSHTFEPVTANFLDQFGLGSIDLDVAASMRVMT